MKTRNILFGLFTFLTIGIYAQTESGKYETKTGINEIKFVFENMSELDNFDWKELAESFKSNEPEQKIKIGFAYKPKKNGEIKKGTEMDNFELTISGESSNIDDIIKRTKRVLDNIRKLNEKDKN
jgi:hypothetical protein